MQNTEANEAWASYRQQQSVFKLPTATGESDWGMMSSTDGHFQKFLDVLTLEAIVSLH